jgi:hypothetical protein
MSEHQFAGYILFFWNYTSSLRAGEMYLSAAREAPRDVCDDRRSIGRRWGKMMEMKL